MNIIASYVHDEVHPEAHIILGSSMNLRSEASDLTVTIIATGFEDMMKTRMNNKNMLHNNQQNNNFGYSVNYPYQNNQNSYRQHMQSYQNQPFPANGMHEKSEHKPTDPVNLKNIDIPTFIRNQN
jgi:cell division GTPase FtsZ